MSKISKQFKTIHSHEPLCSLTYGSKAARINRLAVNGFRIPEGIAFSQEEVTEIASSSLKFNASQFFGSKSLLCLRSSLVDSQLGGPTVIKNIGLNDVQVEVLAENVGLVMALEMYHKFIEDFSILVFEFDLDYSSVTEKLGVEKSSNQQLESLKEKTRLYKKAFFDEFGHEFPEDINFQVELGIKAMTKIWQRPAAKHFRKAHGVAPENGLGIIIQRTVLTNHIGVSGNGYISNVDYQEGVETICGNFSSYEEIKLTGTFGFLDYELGTNKKDDRKDIKKVYPELFKGLTKIIDKISNHLVDKCICEFIVDNGKIFVIDAGAAPRSPQAAVRVVVDLVKAGKITEEEALMRIEPSNLLNFLHPTLAPIDEKEICGNGISASPGAATGRLAFTSEDAINMKTQGISAILIRQETNPEDVRGMHASVGILTARGGMTSHAAVIARGLGLPCVVGATDLIIDISKKTLVSNKGDLLFSGDLITIDGTQGYIYRGQREMILPKMSSSFNALMHWSDLLRSLEVRANADTPQDAQLSRNFGADGIGLCRTEHMFLDEKRIFLMRQMILAEKIFKRKQFLDELLPLLEQDFVELFKIMKDLPVCIRLLDTPLNDFLPNTDIDKTLLADSLGISISEVVKKCSDLNEVNPMLGKRGVRLGIMINEIYEMQVRAIFRAIAENCLSSQKLIVPEIMLPLVSSEKEVIIVKKTIDKVVGEISTETSLKLDYKLGIMVETPRAALRAGDLAKSSDFFSFGTNDLTQMTFGLSRDDASQFLPQYIEAGIFPNDPFESLDLEGVGELILLAAERGRKKNSKIVLSLCGEHGGDATSIRFCKSANFDYVSCSPFRVPIAKLAAAQASIVAKGDV